MVFPGFPWYSTMVTPFFMAKKGSTQWPLRIRCAGSLAMIPMWPPSWAAQWSAEGCWNELQKKGPQNGDAERDAVLYSLYGKIFSGILKHGFAKVFLCLFCSAGVVHWFNCLIWGPCVSKFAPIDFVSMPHPSTASIYCVWFYYIRPMCDENLRHLGKHMLPERCWNILAGFQVGSWDSQSRPPAPTDDCTFHVRNVPIGITMFEPCPCECFL